MTEPVRIAVVGTGLIGGIHAERVAACPDTELAVLCGLDRNAPGLAKRLSVPLVDDFRATVDHQIDAAVVATPNRLHSEMAIWFLEDGIPVLVEKPITDSVEAGLRLCDAAAQAGLPVLVGHHRRHHPMVQLARKTVASELGTFVGSSTLISFRKPDSYYEPDWRRSDEAGPLLINLIHEVDLLRFMCDEIEAVQAVTRRLNRSWDFDDTSAIVVHFRSGAVGTIFLSDSVSAPWSWEGSVSDGIGFHNHGQDYLQAMGTKASLSIPSLTVWRYSDRETDPGWYAPLQTRRLDIPSADPYALQIAHFARVVRDEEPPVVTGEDGLRSLAVVAAVIEAGKSGRIVEIDSILGQ